MEARGTYRTKDVGLGASRLVWHQNASALLLVSVLGRCNAHSLQGGGEDESATSLVTFAHAHLRPSAVLQARESHQNKKGEEGHFGERLKPCRFRHSFQFSIISLDEW